MRLILALRGVNVVDLELRWPIKPPVQEQPPALEATGGGQFERTEPWGDPATTSGFGFQVR